MTVHILRPQGRPTRLFLDASSRAAIAAEIERLIAILDRAGPDPDLEPDDSGVGDKDGLWEQGHLAGRGLELLAKEVREARATELRLAEIVSRVKGREVQP